MATDAWCPFSGMGGERSILLPDRLGGVLQWRVSCMIGVVVGRVSQFFSEVT